MAIVDFRSAIGPRASEKKPVQLARFAQVARKVDINRKCKIFIFTVVLLAVLALDVPLRFEVSQKC